MLADDIYSTLQSRFSGRFWPDVPKKGNTSLPFGIYSMVDNVPNNELSGFNGAQHRYQVDIFSTTRRGANTVADLIITDMDAASLFKSVCVMRQESFEDDVEYYRTTLHFSVFQ